MSWTITPQQKNKGLLDEFTGAAAAYSLRDLTFLRGGPVVRVRRSSDNTEQDFTATQVTNGTLTTFCGAGNGFVRTWYDQSGNGRNAEQTTTASQPQIVSSGALLTKNSKPSIDFDGTNDFLSNTTAINQQITLFIVCSTDVTPATVADIVFDGNSNVVSRNTFFVDAATRKVGVFAGTSTVVTSTSPAIDTLFLGYGFYNTTQSAVGLNGLTATTGNAGAQALNLGWRIGAEATLDPLYSWDGRISEVVFWASNQSANRTAIESNINAHYAIY
jgi:hypothetical protein